MAPEPRLHRPGHRTDPSWTVRCPWVARWQVRRQGRRRRAVVHPSHARERGRVRDSVGSARRCRAHGTPGPRRGAPDGGPRFAASRRTSPHSRCRRRHPLRGTSHARTSEHEALAQPLGRRPGCFAVHRYGAEGPGCDPVGPRCRPRGRADRCLGEPRLLGELGGRRVALRSDGPAASPGTARYGERRKSMTACWPAAGSCVNVQITAMPRNSCSRPRHQGVRPGRERRAPSGGRVRVDRCASTARPGERRSGPGLCDSAGTAAPSPWAADGFILDRPMSMDRAAVVRRARAGVAAPSLLLAALAGAVGARDSVGPARGCRAHGTPRAAAWSARRRAAVRREPPRFASLPVPSEASAAWHVACSYVRA